MASNGLSTSASTAIQLPQELDEAYVKVEQCITRIDALQKVLATPLVEFHSNLANFVSPEACDATFRELHGQMAKAIAAARKDIEAEKQKTNLDAIRVRAELEAELNISRMRAERCRQISRSASRSSTPFPTRESVRQSRSPAQDCEDRPQSEPLARPGGPSDTPRSSTQGFRSFKLASTSCHTSPLPSRHSSPYGRPSTSLGPAPGDTTSTVTRQEDIFAISKEWILHSERGRSFQRQEAGTENDVDEETHVEARLMVCSMEPEQSRVDKERDSLSLDNTSCATEEMSLGAMVPFGKSCEKDEEQEYG